MPELKDLLLNVLIVLLPIFIYQTVWVDKAPKLSPSRNKLVIALFSTASVVLCMMFPVNIIPGFLFDLRLVPMVIGILYGGCGGALFLIAVFCLYRFSIGGIGALYMSATFPVMWFAAFAIQHRFPDFSRRKKKLWAMGLAILELVILIGAVIWQMPYPALENPYLPFFLSLTVITLGCIWVAVYLIESMQEKVVLRHEIEQAEKLKVLGELTATMAHEIRNPLTVVRGFLQLLQTRQIADDKKQVFLKMGIEELDRSETIIANYLSYTRPQLEKVVRIDACERLGHVAGIISSYAALRGVEIQTHCEPGLYIQGDPEKWSQVLMNLIKNGIEAMPDGGTLLVSAKRRNRQIVVHVIDHGVGMTREECARLGNPFYSTKENGTGLGLMVCYQIVHSMNGTIEVTSEKGQGAQFAITLPAY